MNEKFINEVEVAGFYHVGCATSIVFFPSWCLCTLYLDACLLYSKLVLL